MAVFSPNIFTQQASVSVWRLPHQQHPLCSLKQSWNEKKLAKMSHLHIFIIIILQMVQHSSLAICRRDLLCADYGWKYFLDQQSKTFLMGDQRFLD